MNFQALLWLPPRPRDKRFDVGNVARQGSGHPSDSLGSDYQVIFDADADRLVFLEGRLYGRNELFILGSLRLIIEGIHAYVYAWLVLKLHAGLKLRATPD